MNRFVDDEALKGGPRSLAPRDIVRAIRADRRGAAALELALMSPMLVLLIMGLVDFGNASYALMEVNAAAHAGVMYAYANPLTCTTSAITTAEQSATSLGTNVSTTPPGSGVSVVTAAAPTCSFSGCVNGAGTALVSSTSTCAAGDAPGTYAVAYAKASLTPLLPWTAFNLPTTLSATAVMRYK